MDAKAYYERYHREDPSSTYRPEHEATFPQRLAWFSRYVHPGSKVLDYGCGEGVLLAGLHERIGLHPDSCGVDLSDNAVRKARARFAGVRFLPTDPHGTAPCSDGFFDAVIASEVIEHVFDTEFAFGEFSRLLRTQGSLLLSCPYHGFLKDLGLVLTGRAESHYHDPYSNHIRYYSPSSLNKVLHQRGFRALHWGGVGRLPFLWHSLVVHAVKERGL